MSGPDHQGGGQRLSEAEIIARVARRFTTADPRIAVGIGDDAAALTIPVAAADARQLVTTDLLVEGVHFERRLLNFADIGYKALAVNLSDIAAMGGRPTLAFGALGVPRSATALEIDALLDGIEQAARGAGVVLAGGDTVAAPQWVIGFTVLGEVDGQPLLRSGARPGDILWHSGQLGLSQLGLCLLCAGRDAPADPAEQAATTAHRRPQPRLELGQWLQKAGLASACLDLSDSLAQCLLQLAMASDAGLLLDFRDYAFAAAVRRFTERQPRWTEGGAGAFVLPSQYDPARRQQRYSCLTEFVLSSAEDYELLLTAPATASGELLNASPLPLGRLGTVTEAGQGRLYIDEGGRQQELQPLGFTHL